MNHMSLITTLHNVKYLSSEGKINVYEIVGPIPAFINQSLITSVFAFIIHNDKVLVIRNKKPSRGIEIPGGHVEHNESPEAALKRECLEEAYAYIKDIKPCALYEITDPNATKYPKKSYQAFFMAKVDHLDPFTENDEIQERFFLDKNELKKTDWAQEFPDLINIILTKF